MFAGGTERQDPAHEAAVLTVLAYLFEQCDIFERPSGGGGTMILPTKRLGEDRALLTLGGEVLLLLTEPKTVSRLWNELKAQRAARPGSTVITFDWFILALDLLYMMEAVELERGRLRRTRP